MQSRGHDKYFASPSIPSVTEFGLNLSGTADAKSWVIIAVGDTQYRTKADKQGNWQILNLIQDDGTVIIFAMNNHGVRSDSIQIAQILELTNIPSTPEVIERGEYLVGKADASNMIIVTKDGREYITVTDENSDWSMLNPIKNGGAAIIVAEDHHGVRSEEISIAKLVLPFEQEGDLSALLVTQIEDQGVDQPSESDIVINIDILLNGNMIDDSQLIILEDGNAFDVKTPVQQQETPHLMMSFDLSQLQFEQISTYWVA